MSLEYKLDQPTFEKLYKQVEGLSWRVTCLETLLNAVNNSLDVLERRNKWARSTYEKNRPPDPPCGCGHDSGCELVEPRKATMPHEIHNEACGCLPVPKYTQFTSLNISPPPPEAKGATQVSPGVYVADRSTSIFTRKTPPEAKGEERCARAGCLHPREEHLPGSCCRRCSCFGFAFTPPETKEEERCGTHGYGCGMQEKTCTPPEATPATSCCVKPCCATDPHKRLDELEQKLYGVGGFLPRIERLEQRNEWVVSTYEKNKARQKPEATPASGGDDLPKAVEAERNRIVRILRNRISAVLNPERPKETVDKDFCIAAELTGQLAAIYSGADETPASGEEMGAPYLLFLHRHEGVWRECVCALHEAPVEDAYGEFEAKRIQEISGSAPAHSLAREWWLHQRHEPGAEFLGQWAVCDAARRSPDDIDGDCKRTGPHPRPRDFEGAMSLWFRILCWLWKVCYRHRLEKDFHADSQGGWYTCAMCLDEQDKDYERTKAEVFAELGVQEPEEEPGGGR